MVNINDADGYIEIKKEPIVIDIEDLVETIHGVIEDYFEQNWDEKPYSEDFQEAVNFILEQAKYY